MDEWTNGLIEGSIDEWTDRGWMVSKVCPLKKSRNYDTPVTNFISKYTISHEKETETLGEKPESKVGKKFKKSLEFCVIKSKG